jgi:hypothetical protein
MTAASGEDRTAPTRVTFRYARSADYRIVAANGAAGGLTPQGDLLISFFVESAAFPPEATHPVDADGKLGPQESPAQPGTPEVERHLQVGVLLSRPQAAALADWIRARLNEASPGTGEDT